VVAGSQLDVVARLAVTPEALLPAMEQLARQSVNELKAGRKLSFEIPYNLEGTVFGDAGSLGRVAAGSDRRGLLAAARRAPDPLSLVPSLRSGPLDHRLLLGRHRRGQQKVAGVVH
jgi:hypothetical protein